MNKLGALRRIGISFVFCGVAAIATPAQTTAVAQRAPVFTTLYSFDGTDGQYPYASLVQGTDGNFYGTTLEGGTHSSKCSSGGCGTIFKITPNGNLTTIYNFCSLSRCADGNEPFGLVQGADGNFYGTTSGRGVSGEYGTVFKITSSGMLTTLHSFEGRTANILARR